jgi:hypothetical protein
LSVEQIDIVNLRRLDRPPGISATGDQIVALDDQLVQNLYSLRRSPS